jgi:hypothetical protein
LDELDRVAVRIGHLDNTEVGQEVVWRTKRRRAVGSQTRVVTVSIVGPEDDLGRSPVEAWVQPVIGDRGLVREVAKNSLFGSQGEEAVSQLRGVAAANLLRMRASMN